MENKCRNKVLALHMTHSSLIQSTSWSHRHHQVLTLNHLTEKSLSGASRTPEHCLRSHLQEILLFLCLFRSPYTYSSTQNYSAVWCTVYTTLTWSRDHRLSRNKAQHLPFYLLVWSWVTETHSSQTVVWHCSSDVSLVKLWWYVGKLMYWKALFTTKSS